MAQHGSCSHPVSTSLYFVRFKLLLPPLEFQPIFAFLNTLGPPFLFEFNSIPSCLLSTVKDWKHTNWNYLKLLSFFKHVQLCTKLQLLWIHIFVLFWNFLQLPNVVDREGFSMSFAMVYFNKTAKIKNSAQLNVFNFNKTLTFTKSNCCSCFQMYNTVHLKFVGKHIQSTDRGLICSLRRSVSKKLWRPQNSLQFRKR